MAESIIQRAFAGGELAPALHARADQVKYVTGLRTCRNFLIDRPGGISNRAGTRFVEACKTNDHNVRIFRFNTGVAGESVLVEAGEGYLRFYQDGARVTVSGVAAWSGATAYVIGDLVSSAGVNYYCIADNTGNAPPNATFWYPLEGDIYEIPTPFTNDGICDWEQSGNVVTLTHQNDQPHELIYASLTLWVLRAVSTAPAIAAPTGLGATAGGPGSRTFSYVVTAGAEDSYEESLPSTPAAAGAAGDPTPTTPNVLAWTAVAGAVEYYVYCDPFGNGVYGFIGTAATNAFNDTGFTPDFAVTPPIPRLLFQTPGNFPAVSASHQQRRLFANTLNDKEAVFGSRVGFISNFSISSPLQDDDAITFRIVGKSHNPVRHLVGLKKLVVLTDGGAWPINGDQTGAITPSAIGPEQETYVGIAAQPVPVIVGNSIIYVQTRGSIVRDLQFDQNVEGFNGRDLTVFAAHLFDGYTIDRMDYQYTPNSIVWACRSDGTLLGLTYIREQEMWGWHRHDTLGRFEDVCVVPEADEDAVYFVTRRTINGNFRRYIERLERRDIDPTFFAQDAFFVDAGLSYLGPPVSAVAGLDHLEGEIVAVVGDGTVIFNGDPTASNAESFRVSGGAIALGGSFSVVHAGLPIRYAEFETLDLDVQGAQVRDKKKRVGSVTLLLNRSARTFLAGPDSSHLQQDSLAAYETAVDEFTGAVELNLTSAFNDNGRVFVRHTDPLPLSVLGIIPNLTMGG